VAMEKTMNIVYKISIVVAVLLFAGCGDKVTPIEISTKPVEKPQLTLPAADTLRLREIKWIIVTEDNAQSAFDQLKADGKDPVLFGLSDEGYEALSLNLADVRRYIQQQKTIIASYGRYYLNAEEKLEAAQRQLVVIEQQIAEENKRRSSSSNSIFSRNN
jgi:hypothetical protein